mgnify:CR=1 FL=1
MNNALEISQSNKNIIIKNKENDEDWMNISASFSNEKNQQNKNNKDHKINHSIQLDRKENSPTTSFNLAPVNKNSINQKQQQPPPITTPRTVRSSHSSSRKSDASQINEDLSQLSVDDNSI